MKNSYFHLLKKRVFSSKRHCKMCKEPKLSASKRSACKNSGLKHILQLLCMPVVPGCAGCAMAHPDFDRSVNPISTRGDKICPPNYYWHTRIFRPFDDPVMNETLGEK